VTYIFEGSVEEVAEDGNKAARQHLGLQQFDARKISVELEDETSSEWIEPVL
jgi:hypothetical protein